MGFIEEKKKRDQSTISIAFIVGTAVFSIVWFLRSLSMALAMATAAVLLTWGTSTWLQSEPKSAFQKAVSKYKFQEKDLIPLVVGVLAWGVSKFLVGEFLGVMVGGMVGWILHKRLEEKERLQKLEEEWERLQELKEKEWRRLQRLEEERRRLQESEEKERRRLQMLEEEERKRLQELEEKERRKKRVEDVMSGVLGFAAAAGATAFTVLGMLKAFDGGPGGEDDDGDEDKNEKMMKAGLFNAEERFRRQPFRVFSPSSWQVIINS